MLVLTDVPDIVSLLRQVTVDLSGGNWETGDQQ
jgi:hypothetical protein